jgi:hypothetical protein
MQLWNREPIHTIPLIPICLLPKSSRNWKKSSVAQPL